MGGKMRRVARFVAGAALALSAAACSPLDFQYFREGIGTDLYLSDVANVTELQNVYLEYLCRQASPVIGAGGDARCSQAQLGPKEWALVVQAGMNDIDRRCDSYLAWLDARKRSTEPILKELAALSASTTAILKATDVGAKPIALVGIAFGMAADAFTNINSRLLLELPHTTVQTVVLGHQNEYRDKVKEYAITNKPAVVYLLRGYLRTCMPFSIEMGITNTLAVYHRAGPEALVGSDPIINPTPVATPSVTATQRIVQPGRRFVALSGELAPFFDEALSQTEGERVLNALCLNKNASNGIRKAEIIRTLILIYEKSADLNAEAVGRIDRQDRETIVKQIDCGPAKNYYERLTFANTTSNQARTISANAVKSLMALLNRSDAGGPIDPNASLANARTKIAAVRGDAMIANQLKLKLPTQFGNQVTPDLMEALTKLQPR